MLQVALVVKDNWPKLVPGASAKTKVGSTYTFH